jgi:type IV pilus assembly protein PilN
MRLTINLATRRYINLRQLNGILLVFFLAAGALALYQAGECTKNAAELTRIRSLIQGTGTREGGVRIGDAQLKTQGARIRFANQAIEKKSVNWLNLLDRLEEVVPDGVTLTQIEPDSQKLLKLAGAARSFANLRVLMENMERSKNFSEVYLLSQKEAKVGLTQHGITFDLSCKVDLK